VTPYYDDGQVTLYCADFRAVPASELVECAACVVTSPPYNVGLGYDGDDQADTLPWDEYWRLADAAAVVMARALVPGGRVWANTAVSVPATPEGSRSGRAGKRRVLLARGWADALELGGAWCWWIRCRGPRCGPVGVRGGPGRRRRRRTCGAITS